MGVRQAFELRRATVRPPSRRHAALLQAVADRAAQLTWTPELLELLLDELNVADEFRWLRAPGLPTNRYAQVVALALLSRHESRLDDFVNAARRLGLLAPRNRRRIGPARNCPASALARHGWR